MAYPNSGPNANYGLDDAGQARPPIETINSGVNLLDSPQKNPQMGPCQCQVYTFCDIFAISIKIKVYQFGANDYHNNSGMKSGTIEIVPLSVLA